MRYVGQYSCGGASAVACKLLLNEKPREQVAIVNAYVKEEHDDNRRFLVDCALWFDHPIIELRDEKYGASTDEVWIKRRFIKGPRGAPCSRELKRKVLDKFLQPGDVIVLGYTAEETHRYDDWIDNNSDLKCWAPLIERGLSHDDCLAIVQRAGIELPMMYRLGYHNANCIGCPKGGAGYWNKIRRDFPERYEAVCKIQDMLGPGSWFLRDRRTGERVSLRNLDPTHGNHDEDLNFSCSFFCEMAIMDLS